MAARFFLLGLVFMTVGCGTARFRVPAEEVQRLAQLPASERGQQVRVIPSVGDAAEAASDPGVPVYAPAEPGGPYLATQVVLDLPGPRGHRRGHRPYARPVSRLPTAAAGSFRGTPVPVSGAASAGRAAASWRGTPRPSVPGMSRPSGGGSSGHRGGGRASGSGSAVAAVVGVVVVVGLVAAIADASAKADEQARFARTYDGWVAVGRDHVLHLTYGNQVTRQIPLSQLTPQDTVGVRFGYLESGGGQIAPLNLPPGMPALPPPPAEPPARTAPPPAPVPLPPAPETPGPPPVRAQEHPALVS